MFGETKEVTVYIGANGGEHPSQKSADQSILNQFMEELIESNEGSLDDQEEYLDEHHFFNTLLKREKDIPVILEKFRELREGYISPKKDPGSLPD